jgi:molybdopterin-guanine dinucleotide biosynthesis protein A
MGRDKAFLEIDGIPLWRRQLQILRALQPAEIFISGPEHSSWANSDLEIVRDAKAGVGPLGGLVAALRRCRDDRLLVLAIDLPNMSSDYLQQLLAFCPNDSGLVPRRNGTFEPLAAIYPASCLTVAESFLQSENYSLQPFVERGTSEGWLKIREVNQSEEPLFLNLNTPADLVAIGKK